MAKTKKRTKRRAKAKRRAIVNRVVRRARRRRARRARNPGAAAVAPTRRMRSARRGRSAGESVGSVVDAITKLPARLQELTKNITPGKVAGAAAGVGGTMVIGTMVGRQLIPLVMKLAPGFAMSPLGARLLSGAVYLGTAWGLAKFSPVSGATKKAMVTGGALAALLETWKPGTVQRGVAKVLGPAAAAQVSGLHQEMGDMIRTAYEQVAGDDEALEVSDYVISDVVETEVLDDYLLAGSDVRHGDELGCNITV